MAPRIRDERTVVRISVDEIRDLISSERLGPGDQLPTEAQLATSIGVSRPALREALKVLEQDGLIRVEHGKGRFISATARIRVERPITCFESATAMVRRFGYDPTPEILHLSVASADREVSQALQLRALDPVLKIERARHHRNKPIIYSMSFIDRSLLSEEIVQQDQGGSLVELLARVGRRPVMSTATASAAYLPSHVKSRPEFADFGASFLIIETCYCEKGDPVLYTRDYHKGDAFSFSFLRK